MEPRIDFRPFERPLHSGREGADKPADRLSRGEAEKSAVEAQLEHLGDEEPAKRRDFGERREKIGDRRAADQTSENVKKSAVDVRVGSAERRLSGEPARGASVDSGVRDRTAFLGEKAGSQQGATRSAGGGRGSMMAYSGKAEHEGIKSLSMASSTFSAAAVESSKPDKPDITIPTFVKTDGSAKGDGRPDNEAITGLQERDVTRLDRIDLGKGLGASLLGGVGLDSSSTRESPRTQKGGSESTKLAPIPVAGNCTADSGERSPRKGAMGSLSTAIRAGSPVRPRTEMEEIKFGKRDKGWVEDDWEAIRKPRDDEAKDSGSSEAPGRLTGDIDSLKREHRAGQDVWDEAVLGINVCNKEDAGFWKEEPIMRKRAARPESCVSSSVSSVASSSDVLCSSLLLSPTKQRREDAFWNDEPIIKRRPVRPAQAQNYLSMSTYNRSPSSSSTHSSSQRQLSGATAELPAPSISSETARGFNSASMQEESNKAGISPGLLSTPSSRIPYLPIPGSHSSALTQHSSLSSSNVLPRSSATPRAYSGAVAASEHAQDLEAMARPELHIESKASATILATSIGQASTTPLASTAPSAVHVSSAHLERSQLSLAERPLGEPLPYTRGHAGLPTTEGLPLSSALSFSAGALQNREIHLDSDMGSNEVRGHSDMGADRRHAVVSRKTEDMASGRPIVAVPDGSDFVPEGKGYESKRQAELEFLSGDPFSHPGLLLFSGEDSDGDASAATTDERSYLERLLGRAFNEPPSVPKTGFTNSDEASQHRPESGFEHPQQPVGFRPPPAQPCEPRPPPPSTSIHNSQTSPEPDQQAQPPLSLLTHQQAALLMSRQSSPAVAVAHQPNLLHERPQDNSLPPYALSAVLHSSQPPLQVRAPHEYIESAPPHTSQPPYYPHPTASAVPNAYPEDDHSALAFFSHHADFPSRGTPLEHSGHSAAVPSHSSLEIPVDWNADRVESAKARMLPLSHHPSQPLPFPASQPMEFPRVPASTSLDRQPVYASSSSHAQVAIEPNCYFGTPIGPSGAPPHARPPSPPSIGGNLLPGEPDMSKTREDDPVWEYRDPTGLIQGLFSTTQMRRWFKGNYFPNDLPMRYDSSLPFVQFSQLFPHGVEPFSSFPRVLPLLTPPSLGPPPSQRPHAPSFAMQAAPSQCGPQEEPGQFAPYEHPESKRDMLLREVADRGAAAGTQNEEVPRTVAIESVYEPHSSLKAPHLNPMDTESFQERPIFRTALHYAPMASSPTSSAQPAPAVSMRALVPSSESDAHPSEESVWKGPAERANGSQQQRANVEAAVSSHENLTPSSRAAQMTSDLKNLLQIGTAANTASNNAPPPTCIESPSAESELPTGVVPLGSFHPSSTGHLPASGRVITSSYPSASSHFASVTTDRSAHLLAGAPHPSPASVPQLLSPESTLLTPQYPVQPAGVPASSVIASHSSVSYRTSSTHHSSNTTSLRASSASAGQGQAFVAHSGHRIAQLGGGPTPNSTGSTAGVLASRPAPVPAPVLPPWAASTAQRTNSQALLHIMRMEQEQARIRQAEEWKRQQQDAMSREPPKHTWNVNKQPVSSQSPTDSNEFPDLGDKLPLQAKVSSTKAKPPNKASNGRATTKPLQEFFAAPGASAQVTSAAASRSAWVMSPESTLAQLPRPTPGSAEASTLLSPQHLSLLPRSLEQRRERQTASAGAAQQWQIGSAGVTVEKLESAGSKPSHAAGDAANMAGGRSKWNDKQNPQGFALGEHGGDGDAGKLSLFAEVEQLMQRCDVVLDRSVLDYVKNFKAAEDLESFLRDSIGDTRQLAKFSAEFVQLMHAHASEEPDQYTEQHANASAPLAKLGSGKGKKKKPKAVVDPSLLGFSVKSNRIMQGTIDMGEE